MSTSKKNPNKIAKEIRREKCLMFLEGEFYLYEGGVFRPIADIEVKKTAKQKLGLASTTHSLNEVLHSLQIECHIKRDDLLGRGRYLNVLNGMIDLEKIKLVEHSVDYFSAVQFPVKFYRKRGCPQFLKAVSEWLDDKKKIQLLQEFLGYCLLPNNGQEKLLFLIGQGGNGKSTLIKVITAVFGRENCSFIALDQLTKKFILSGIRGKTINLSSETPSKAILCDDLIKSIVSGDEILGEEKFKPPFSFIPTAKLIVSCNTMPRTEDRSQAMDRRLLILNFNRTFTDITREQNFDRKLIAEKDGIFLWILKGLLRLQKRGYFEEPEESVREREEFQKENNPVKVFIEECCEQGPQMSVSKRNFYKAYRRYCIDSGYRPLSMRKFGKEIKRVPRVNDEIGTDNGERARMWVGIDLNPNFDMEYPERNERYF